MFSTVCGVNISPPIQKSISILTSSKEHPPSNTYAKKLHAIMQKIASNYAAKQKNLHRNLLNKLTI